MNGHLEGVTLKREFINTMEPCLLTTLQVLGGSSKKNEVESDSISFMVHGSHAGAEFPGDFDKQARRPRGGWNHVRCIRDEIK